MKAMVLREPGSPLEKVELEVPKPGRNQVMIRIEACAVCRTDLHVVDGDLKKPKLPIIPGHEIVGTVVELGNGVDRFRTGQRVGVPWLGWTCGVCSFCLGGEENLCDDAGFTGYTINGGYAEFTVADERFCLPIHQGFSPQAAAPLLCAGLIGYRSLKKAGDAEKIGLYGFGASAHIVIQLAIYLGRQIYAFTRPGDLESQQFANSLGAVWAGDSTVPPPDQLDAAIIFAPVGSLVPLALKAIRKGGVVVCGGIHMTDIPTFPHEILWGEKQVVSVANLTRDDGIEFMELAPKVPVRTTVQCFPLEEANDALDRLRRGDIEGAAVLVMGHRSS